MKKAILTASIAALIAGTALTGTAFAKGGYGARGGGEAAIEHVIRALDLDDAQRTEVRRIADEARPQTRAIADARRDSHEELAALIKADTLDETALRALAQARGDNMAAAMISRVQMMHEIRGVLTDEQLQKLDSMHERRGGGRGQRGGHGQHGGQQHHR